MKRLITFELQLPLSGEQEAIVAQLVQDATQKLQATGLDDMRILFQTRESLEAMKSTYDAGRHYVMMLGEALAKSVIKYFGRERPDKIASNSRDLYDRAEQLLGGESAVKTLSVESAEYRRVHEVGDVDKMLADSKKRGWVPLSDLLTAQDAVAALVSTHRADWSWSDVLTDIVALKRRQLTHSMRSNAQHVRESLKYVAEVPNTANIRNRDALLRLLDEIEAAGNVKYSYDETMIVELGKTAYNYLRERMRLMVDDQFASICYGLYEALTTARDGLTKHRGNTESGIVTNADEWLKSEEARQIIQGGEGRSLCLRYTALIELLAKYAEVAEKNASQSSASQPKKGMTAGLVEQLNAIRLTYHARRVLREKIDEVRISRMPHKDDQTIVNGRALEDLIDLIGRYVS